MSALTIDLPPAIVAVVAKKSTHSFPFVPACPVIKMNVIFVLDLANFGVTFCLELRRACT